MLHDHTTKLMAFKSINVLMFYDVNVPILHH